MNVWLLILALLSTTVWATPEAPSPAKSPGPAAATSGVATDSDAFEVRFRKLTEELRCLVCQNQSLADSHAELAGDLRREVHEMMAKGASDQEITRYLVARYGDFVLYRPPVKATTIMLWFGPFLLLLGGLAVAVTMVRKRARNSAAPLSDDERKQVEALLNAGAKDGRS